jgi:hypothetical protein
MTDPKGVPMTRKPWPSNKPLPRFASEQEELAFWERHDVPWDDEAQWEEVPVIAIGGTKPKAIRMVLPPSQEARLGQIARERRVSKEKALEGIIFEGAQGSTSNCAAQKGSGRLGRADVVAQLLR